MCLANIRRREKTLNGQGIISGSASEWDVVDNNNNNNNNESMMIRRPLPGTTIIMILLLRLYWVAHNSV
jgi:hypothetical protein